MDQKRKLSTLSSQTTKPLQKIYCISFSLHVVMDSPKETDADQLFLWEALRRLLVVMRLRFSQHPSSPNSRIEWSELTKAHILSQKNPEIAGGKSQVNHCSQQTQFVGYILFNVIIWSYLKGLNLLMCDSALGSFPGTLQKVVYFKICVKENFGVLWIITIVAILVSDL